MENLQSAVVFSNKTNPYTEWAFNHPHYKAKRVYINADERYLDQYRFCADKDLQDFVKSGVDLTKPKNKARLKKLALKLQDVVVKMETKAGFVSWYGDLFDLIFADKVKETEAFQESPAPVAVTKPIPAAPTPAPAATPVLLSGEALAKRFMAELLTPDFLAEIAKQQLSEEEMEKVIAARAEAIITSLKELADPEAYAAFYAAYRKQHPAPQEPEMVVAEAAIIETSVDNGEPKVLSELVNQTVEASGSQTAMAEKLSRAAELVKEGKRKNRQQHRRAA